jgi:hypothetical protein
MRLNSTDAPLAALPDCFLRSIELSSLSADESELQHTPPSIFNGWGVSLSGRALGALRPEPLKCSRAALLAMRVSAHSGNDP